MCGARFTATSEKFACVITQPFGRPVVPEVYTSVAVSASPAILRAASTSTSETTDAAPRSSRTCKPRAGMGESAVSSGPDSKGQIVTGSPNEATAARTTPTRWESSANTCRAPESRRIHSTWKGELVS